MQVAGHNVFPADTLAERVKNDKENAKAFVKGIVIIDRFSVCNLFQQELNS